MADETLLADDPNHPTRWRHRRRMAYLALYGMLGVTLAMLTPLIGIDRITALKDVIDTFYFSMAAIVGAYVGFASWSAVWTRKTK